MIFDVTQLVSFLSQLTTLLPGTIILTGTPAGVGFSATPQNFLQAGDEFSVEISDGIGTLTTLFTNEE
jgi:2-keto-4-pentenoate hydratase/2-oxohepta-3-ene-1,7-dioic acid hydratase in catechol pathway